MNMGRGNILKLILLLLPCGASAMTLSEFLRQVEGNNQYSQAYQMSQEAAVERSAAGDLELTPMLSLSGSYLDDKKQPSNFGLNIKQVKGAEYNLGLAKNFSSGTQISVFSKVGQTDMYFVTPDGEKFSGGTGALGVSLSQSLWKNSWGHGTRLRWEREASLMQAEKGSFDLQQRSLMIEAETHFWNYVASLELLKMREASLVRAQKMEAWIKRRVGDGIGDKSDLFNSQSLVESRRLELINIHDELTSLEIKIRNMLRLKPSQKFPDFQGSLDGKRSLAAFLKGRGRIVRLDSYLSYLEAKTKGSVAQEVEDGLRPDLSLEASYNTNAFIDKGDVKTGWDHLKDTDRPTTRVALTFKYFFDSEAKLAKKSGALKEAQSSRLIAEQKLVESETSWSELNRRYEEMSKRIEVAERLAKFQSSRAKEESEKLSKGRTVTSNAITAAQEADEAQLNVTNMKVEQRKMEAQGRMFVNVESLEL